MSTLVVTEMFSGVVVNQPVTISKDISVAHIRPWIYKHGALGSGQLKLSIYQGATLLKTSLVDFGDIQLDKPETYAHGFIRFDFDNLVLYVQESSLETEYIFRFEVINYTNNPNGFIGMCRRYEAKTYPTYGTGVVMGEAPNDTVEPFGLEIYEYKLRR